MNLNHRFGQYTFQLIKNHIKAIVLKLCLVLKFVCRFLLKMLDPSLEYSLNSKVNSDKNTGNGEDEGKNYNDRSCGALVISWWLQCLDFARIARSNFRNNSRRAGYISLLYGFQMSFWYLLTFWTITQWVQYGEARPQIGRHWPSWAYISLKLVVFTFDKNTVGIWLAKMYRSKFRAIANNWKPFPCHHV